MTSCTSQEALQYLHQLLRTPEKIRLVIVVENDADGWTSSHGVGAPNLCQRDIQAAQLSLDKAAQIARPRDPSTN